MPGRKDETDFIARFGEGERLVNSTATLDACLTSVAEKGLSELWLSPATPAKQLGSLALRVFGLKPRPAAVLHVGPRGALVTFRDRNGGDYRVVNREFDGQADRGDFLLYDGRRITHRADEALAITEAFEILRTFFIEGDRPWRLSCRPVTL